MAATATTQLLPHWNMSVVYPGLETPEFAAGFDAAVKAIDGLEALFDEAGVNKGEHRPLDEESIAAFERVVARYDDVTRQVWTLGAYISSFVSTDSRNNLAQARRSELQAHTTRLSQLGTRLTAWVGSLDLGALIERSEIAAEHAFPLHRMSEEARHQMSPGEEALSAELNVTGGSAWSRLHNNLTSQLTVPVELDGETRDMPMSMVRNLAYEPDREVRRRGYEAELEGWKRVALPLSAAINSIKGEVNTLSERRGWGSALDEALFDNNIDRATLDALMEAARESFPDFRRYLRAKARALGIERCAWYDIFAPAGESKKVWEYGDAREFIIDRFGDYSSKLSDFASRAFREEWIDAEPRPGKRDGAFCMWLRGDESRVFSNYKPAYNGVRTLAHELGHAYHNFVRSGATMLQRSTPMTLAETASTFCETIVSQAALQHGDEAEQLYILEASLQDSCQIVVDISSRFLFEQRVFEQRKARELSAGELDELMLQAQRETYGDGLDETVLHPHMWEMKPHYYSTGLSFYNFPYMFGLLFGLGLYARYREDAGAFRSGYDDLLAYTGREDASALASRFGIDIRKPDFWRSSLDVIRGEIDRFEALTGSAAK